MVFKIGRIFVILSLSLLFLAYSNFAPTSLQSDSIAGYVKNHFVREIIFGVVLTVWAIQLALKPIDIFPLKQLTIIGSTIVFPFWIAVLFGWSTQGLAKVWGEAINASAAYILHSTQVGLFLFGLVLIYLAKERGTNKTHN